MIVIAKRLLYLSAHNLTAWLWQQGRLQAEGTFVASEDGLAGFSTYLKSHISSQFSLLANLPEEGFQQETIPFLRGKDRQTLIDRRLGQHFYGTPLATALSLGFEKAKRKNEHLLLMALTNPLTLEPWLQAIAQAEAPLTGIYSLPQLNQHLLAKIPEAENRCLLLTVQDHSIRESFVVDGVTRFSRVAPLHDNSLGSIASEMATEATKLHQYLLGQRLISRDEILTTYLLAHPTTRKAIEQTCIDSGKHHFQFVDSLELAARLDLHSAPDGYRCDPLFLHLLATTPPKQQLAPEGLRHQFRLSQIKQGLLATGLIALAAALIFGGKQQVEHYFLRGDTSELILRENNINRRYQDIVATFPKVEMPHDALRNLMGKYRQLQSFPNSPAAAYALLSRTLNQSPAITLESLDWQLAADDKGNAPSGKNRSFPAYQEEILTVRGNILLGGNPSPRQFVAALESFTSHLEGQPGIKVQVQQQPYDVQSSSALKGGDEESAGDKPRPFALQITRRWQP